jgi:hypothetical protein
MSLKKLPLVKGYPGSEYRKNFDPGSVLSQNAELVKSKQQEIAALPAMDETVKKEVAGLVFSGTESQKNEIASARIDRIKLNVLEALIGMDFFEVTELAHDEIPQLVLQRDQRWVTSQIGMHGGAPYDQFQNLDTLSQFIPYILKSDVATYPIMSPIIGRFVEVAERVNNRVAHDWDRKMDDDLFTLMDANYETTFGAPETIYDLDPKIANAGAYPAGNALNLSATPGVNLNMFKKIFQHYANMGDSGPKVRTIWIPSTELENLWSIGSVVSGFTGGTIQPGQQVSQAIENEIQTKGIIGNLFGHTFRLRITNTFANTYVRVSTDRPFGRLYMKPEFDRVKRYSEDDLEARNSIQNHEGIQISKVVVPIIPSPWKLNSLRVKIN